MIQPRRVLALALAKCGALIAGCVSAPEPVPAPAASPALGVPAPIVTTAEEGLEVHWWIAPDTDGAVGKALAEFAEPALPADPAVRARWNANGLRLVRAPAEQFSALQQRLPAIRTRQKLWLGWMTSWTELFRGRRAGGASALIIDGQRSFLPSGALRLIARCWPAPTAPAQGRQWGGAPLARLELTCQLVEEQRIDSADVFAEPRMTAVADEGPVFRQLTLETLLDSRYVYILTAEAPGVLWKDRGATGSPAPGPADSPPPADPLELESVAADSAALPFEPLGPPVSLPLTIGQAMLSATHAETGWRDVRIVVVLIPRAAARYQLLP